MSPQPKKTLKPKKVIRYILQNKADGLFYTARRYNRAWTDDLAKAKVYTQSGHPRNAVRKPYVSWSVPRKEASKIYREDFDSKYTILKVEVNLAM